MTNDDRQIARLRCLSCLLFTLADPPSAWCSPRSSVPTLLVGIKCLQARGATSVTKNIGMRVAPAAQNRQHAFVGIGEIRGMSARRIRHE
jgi:hypothetical protein